MSGYARKLIDDIYHNAAMDSDEQYSTITVRLDPEHAVMLKSMAKGFGFSVSTVFTDILSRHLFDLAVSLTDDDFNDVTGTFLDFNKQHRIGSGSAVERLLEAHLIPHAELNIKSEDL